MVFYCARRRRRGMSSRPRRNHTQTINQTVFILFVSFLFGGHDDETTRASPSDRLAVFFLSSSVAVNPGFARVVWPFFAPFPNSNFPCRRQPIVIARRPGTDGPEEKTPVSNDPFCIRLGRFVLWRRGNAGERLAQDYDEIVAVERQTWS